MLKTISYKLQGVQKSTFTTSIWPNQYMESAYRCTLNNFTRFYSGSVTEINAGVLRRYLATVSGSPNNRAHYYSNLKVFLNWCYRFNYIPANPISSCKRKPAPAITSTSSATAAPPTS